MTTTSTEARLVFMGMVIDASEAVELLAMLLVLASTVQGCSPNNGNWAVAQEMAKRAQERLLAMHTDPDRQHVHCAVCGQSRDDVITPPVHDPHYRVGRVVTKSELHLT